MHNRMLVSALAALAASVVWMVCPTGGMAQAMSPQDRCDTDPDVVVSHAELLAPRGLVREAPYACGVAPANELVEVFLDGQFIERIEADARGRWSVNLASLEQGSHSLVIRAPQVPAVSEVFEVDSVAPTLRVDSPSTRAYTRSRRPEIRGFAEAGTRVYVSLDGRVASTRRAGEDGAWSWTPLHELEVGKHNYAVVAEDNAGNTTSLGGEFIIDRTPPRLTMTAPAEGASLSVAPRVARVEMSEAVAWQLWFDHVLVDQGEAERGALDLLLPEGIEDGAHHVLVTARDAVGNQARVESSFSLDTTAPTLRIRSPRRSQVIVGGVVHVLGDAEPGAMVEVEVHGAEVLEVEAGPSGVWAVSFEEPLERGSHTLEVIARDALGNRSREALTFRVDPAMHEPARVLSPSRGATVGSAPRFVGSATAGRPVELFIDGTLAARTVASEEGEWGVIPGEELLPGEHVVWARVPGEPLGVSVPFAVRSRQVEVLTPTPIESVRYEVSEDRAKVSEPAQRVEREVFRDDDDASDAACAMGGAMPARGDGAGGFVWLLGLLALHWRRHPKSS